jgi:hypothetical protein
MAELNSLCRIGGPPVDEVAMLLLGPGVDGAILAGGDGWYISGDEG